MAKATGAARDSAGLLFGTVVNGLFAYVFFAMATRTLGATAAAPIAVLWTYWGMATAAITFPIQHWIIRTMRADGEQAVGASLPRITLAVTMFAVASTVATWLVDDRLFARGGVVFPVLIGLVTLGAYFTGVVRGGLAGREAFAATAVALAADNVTRVVLGAVVLFAGGGAVALGAVLAAGALIEAVWPSGYRFRFHGGTARARPSLAFLGGIATGSLLGQLVLVGGPAALALLGGAPQDVTMLFAVLALFRAPYLLAVGVANRLTGSLTEWSTAHRQRQVRRFQVAVVTATVAGGAVAGLGAQAFGPMVVSAVFGSETSPPGWLAAVIAIASIIAVGNLILSLLTIAQHQGGRLTRAWIIALAGIAVMLATGHREPLEAVTWALVVGEGLAFLALLGSTRRLEGAAPATALPSDSGGVRGASFSSELSE